MSRAGLVAWTRVGVIAAAVLSLEALCRFGVIKPLTMIAPSQMVAALWAMIEAGEVTSDFLATAGKVGAACVISVVAGFGLGVLVHRAARVRRAIAPVLASWYAVPFFVFYPLLVALFGLNSLPLIAIGVVFAVPAMMLSTLAGLDRVPLVLRKVARVHRIGGWREAALITLPSRRRICSRG